MIGAILAIVAIVLLLLTFVTPLYRYSAEMEMWGETFGGSADFYYTEGRTDFDGETETEEYDDDSEMKSVFNLTMILVIIAVIGSILGMIGALMVGMGKIDNKIGAGLAVIGILFAFIAPMYLMVSLPGAFDEDNGGMGMNDDDGPWDSFFGSTSEEGFEMRWGPSIAWYMALIAGVLNIGVLAMVMSSKPAPTGPYQQQPQQPYQEQQWQEQPPQQQWQDQPPQQQQYQQPPQQQPPQQNEDQW